MKNNDNATECMSQNKQIKAWLESGKSITQMEALKYFGCFRLASRINDLRNRGMNITMCKITTPSGKRIAEYVLAK